jgi:hypothetical protein
MAKNALKNVGKTVGLLMLLVLGLFLSNRIGPPISETPQAECRAVAAYAGSKFRKHVSPVLDNGKGASLDCTHAFRQFHVDISEQACAPDTACFENEYSYRRARSDKLHAGVFTIDEGMVCGSECSHGTDITFVRIAGWWFAVKWQHTWIS